MRNNGDLRLCAHSQHGSDQGLLRDEDGVPFNAGSSSIPASRNSDMLKSVRKSMLSGKWHDACYRCKHEHESGMRSRNAMESELWSHRFTEEDARRLTAEDGSVDVAQVPVMHYGLRFGNKCNLKCRMCGPTESNLWYDDYAAVWGTREYDDSFGKVRLVESESGKLIADTNRYSWYESEKFWEYMASSAADIVHVHTAGGEPTLIDEQYSFLERCVSSGISRNLVIEYNSNVTKIPDKSWDLWRNFREVRIGASIDGVGRVNDYIRHPSRWDLIERNLRRLDEDSGINFIVWIASTVQVYNIYYLPEMLEFFMRAKFTRIGMDDINPLINFHPLYGPKWLSCRILPRGTKERISSRFAEKSVELEHLAHELFPGEEHKRDMIISGVKRHLDTYSRFMWQEDLSSLMPKFWKYTKSLDGIRGESMEESLPEFAACLGMDWR